MTSKFNEKSTGNEVAEAYAANIKDKVVLTTGVSPNSLGAEFVQTIAAQSPALLILAGRNQAKLDETKKTILDKTPNANLRLLILDLGNLKQVSEAAAEVNAYSETLDVLMNNAGLMAHPYNTTVDGFESQFGTNHLGHYLFTRLLLPKILKRGKELRIVNVSSSGHQFSGIRWGDFGFNNGADYDKWAAYGQAKTANILFSLNLAERYGQQGVKAYSVHPGTIWTNLGTHLTETDIKELLDNQKKLLGSAAPKSWEEIKFKSSQEGASTHVLASFAPDLPNGVYLLDTRVAKPEEIKSKADDKEEAKKLWVESEKLVAKYL